MDGSLDSNDSITWEGMSPEEKLNLISPPLKGQEGRDPCMVYDANLTDLLEQKEECPTNWTQCTDTLLVKTCDEWEYAQTHWEQTLVARFHLVCGRAWMKGLAKSVQLMGQLVGMLVSGALSDKFGRRMVMRAALVVSVITRVTMALSPAFPVYLITRFVCGSTDLIVKTSSYLLCTELLNVKTRALAVVTMAVGFASGCMASPLVAFLLPNWTYLSLTTTAITTLLVLPVFLLPESPRWLFCVGRHDQAKDTLKWMAKVNHREIPVETSYLVDMDVTRMSGPGITFFLHHKLVIFRLAMSMYLWFCTSMVYYGIALNVSSLAGSIYINSFIMGAIDLPGDILMSVIVNSWLGRRYTVLFSLLVCTVALYADIACPQDSIGRNVLSIIGKLAVGTTFTALYVLTPELFPTGMRGTALGSSSAMARVGSSISPFIAQSGGHITAITFGTAAALGLIACLTLPETRNHTLPISIQDMKQQRSLICPCLEGSKDTGDDKKSDLEKESVLQLST